MSVTSNETLQAPVKLTAEQFASLANEKDPRSQESLEYMGSLGLKGSGLEPIIIVDGDLEREGFINTSAEDFGTFVYPKNVTGTAENDAEMPVDAEQRALDAAKSVMNTIQAAIYNGHGDQFGSLLHQLESAILGMRKVDTQSLKAGMLDAHLKNLRQMYAADMNNGTFTPENYIPSVTEVIKNL